jgi:ribosomal protein S18 acetylase RimI-like enzyme
MSKSTQSVTLRAATPNDEGFLLQLFASTRMDEFRFLDADERQKEALITMQYNIRRLQYDDGYPQAEASIILFDERAVGRMLIDESEREITLVDIALMPDHRNSGIGTHLIKQLLNRAVSANKPVRLQVLKSSPAGRLYERLGFLRVEDQSMYLEMMFEPKV